MKTFLGGHKIKQILNILKLAALINVTSIEFIFYHLKNRLVGFNKKEKYLRK